MTNAFEERKEARINRLNSRAEKHKSKGESLINESSNMASVIPMGQPILVGHHSERRDRKFRERIRNKMSKGCEALDYSKQLDRRAEAAASNTAIMSDDPEAITKLKEKILRHENFRTKIKEENATARKLKEEKPHASYSLTNLSQNLSTMKKRLANLEAMANREPIEFTVNEIEVSEADGRIIVTFPYKPCGVTRNHLKRSPLALKWSSYQEAWVRKLTPSIDSYFIERLKKVLDEAKA